MQIKKTIEVGDGRKIVVQELKVSQIFESLQEGLGMSSGEIKLDFRALVGGLEQVMELTTGLTRAELMDLYPSDLQKILDTVKQVNKSFFDLMERSDILPILSQMWETLRKGFLNKLTLLSAVDTSLLGTMAGHASSEAFKPFNGGE